EGVVNGHFTPAEPEKIRKIGRLRQGVSKILEDRNFSPSVEEKYTVADMITGYGVAESVFHYYDIWSEDKVEEKKAIVQGFGNVGAAAAYYLAKRGVKVVGIIDRDGGIINEEGIPYEEIRQLFINRVGNTLKASNLLSFEEVNEKIWDLDSDIFIPAASSRLITADQINRMVNAGLEVISCGANVPFKDPEIFYGDTAELADQKVSLIPDFIANCGMARVFAYLMEEDSIVTDESIFHDTSETIREALVKTHDGNPEKTMLTQASYEVALRELL
ncbi:MAG: amino acid dehydrogenase, partial [Cyclobacteriaceae bacterium]